MAVINFDSSQVAPSTGVMDALPAGWYNAMIKNSELKPTKDSATTGNAYLSLEVEIVDGFAQGRKIFANLNIRNTNPVAQDIAYKDLSAICHAVGAVGMVQDSSMLHNRPMKIKLNVKPATDKYEAGNEIKAWKNVNEQVALASAPVPGTGNPSALAPASFPPAGGQAPAFAPAAQPWQVAGQAAPVATAPAFPQVAAPQPMQQQPQFAQQPTQQPAQQFAAPAAPVASYQAPAAPATPYQAPAAPVAQPQIAQPVQYNPAQAQQFAAPAQAAAPVGAPPMPAWMQGSPVAQQ